MGKHTTRLRWKNMDKVNFYGVNLNLIDTKELLESCEGFLEQSGTKTVFFLNAHYYNIACKDKQYKNLLNKCDLLLNDGIGIRLGLKLKGLKEKENMNGTDLIPKIIELSANNNSNMYLLGGVEGVAKKASEKIKEKWKNAKIAGEHSGFFDKEEEEEIINEIVNNKIDVLIVGMGAPLQEKWIYDNWDKLQSVKIIVAGGAILDFISEKVTRAPMWVRKLNMEWVYRLLLEPKRLFDRYVIGNFKFFINISCNRKEQ